MVCEGIQGGAWASLMASTEIWWNKFMVAVDYTRVSSYGDKIEAAATLYWSLERVDQQPRLEMAMLVGCAAMVLSARAWKSLAKCNREAEQ
jgi:hypothetical protein